MKLRILVLGIAGLFWSCQQEKESQLNDLNLLQYGIPMTILAPDSSKVNATEIMGIKDVTIKSGDNYAIQIYSSDATTTNVATILAEQKEIVEGSRYFAKIVREEPGGFIYQSAIDTATLNFDFRYVRVKGDKEYIFQTGLLGSFSEDDVEIMYNAVKPESERN